MTTANTTEPRRDSDTVHGLVGPDFHPPLGIMGGSVHCYRRAMSPWHRDAFPDEFKDSAPEQGPLPADGWMAEDWCGNPVAFFPDGMPWPAAETKSSDPLPACSECERVMRKTPKGWTCTICGHRERDKSNMKGEAPK